MFCSSGGNPAGNFGEDTLGVGMLGAGGVSILEAIAALGADCCKSAWLNVIVAKFPSLLIVTFVAPTRSDHSMLAIL